MTIILVGCGKIGSSIIKSMTDEEHDVTVIDLNTRVIETISNSHDVIAVCGNGTSFETLNSAGAPKCDLFIAATASDEVNMLSCFIANNLGAKHTVARVRDSEYSSKNFDYIKNSLNISLTINPEKMTARALYNLLKLPPATKVESFTDHSFSMIELTLNLDSQLLGVPLIELRKQIHYQFLIAVVLREDKVYVPHGSFVLEAGDRIEIITLQSNVHKLLKIMGFGQKPIKDVMIAGGGKTATYLLEYLLPAKNSVTVIEKDPDSASLISDVASGDATIIVGDAMNQDLLSENGISSVDAFVALTNKDEENILMSIYANKKDVSKVICKINKPELINISSDLGINCAVSPQNIVAELLVKYARALESSKESKIELLYNILNGKAQALEFSVLDDFKLTNIPLKDLKLAPNTIIGGIIRGKENILPNGDDVITAGDKVAIITSNEDIYDLSDALEKA